MNKPIRIGVRVRLLKKHERAEPDFLAWAVEKGVLKGKYWTETVILSEHSSELEASAALCELVRNVK